METQIRSLQVSDTIINLLDSYKKSPLCPTLLMRWDTKITTTKNRMRINLSNQVRYQHLQNRKPRFATIKLFFLVEQDGTVIFDGMQIPVMDIATHHIRVRLFTEFENAFPFVVVKRPLTYSDFYVVGSGDKHA